MNPDATPILLDTDIGTDIDDALALSYLLCHPKCHLVGITTVGPEAGRRADLARALCEAWGHRHVPVFAGHEPAAGLHDRRTAPWQADLLEVRPPPQTHDPRDAIDFLANVIPVYTGRITLVSIGPLTNLARLVEANADAAALLDAAVSMCGLYTAPPAEYGAVETNIGLDPEAAARVMKARLPQHRVLGLEVTGAFALGCDELRSRLPKSVPRLLLALLDAWARRRKTVRFHDPMAAACVFAPELFTFGQARCEVSLAPRDAFGRTSAARAGDDLPHRLLTRADYDAFVRHFCETLASRS